MITIYHNPKCSKSRAGLALLEEKGEKIEIKEYLKNSITKNELKDILKKLNCSPIDIVRKNEQDYKDNFKDKSFTDDEWIDILIENPKLIERPIVVKDSKAVIARPCELIETIL